MIKYLGEILKVKRGWIKMKYIAIRTPQNYGEDYFYDYFVVDENFVLDKEKFEKRFHEVYENTIDWAETFSKVCEEFGLTKTPEVEVIDLNL